MRLPQFLPLLLAFAPLILADYDKAACNNSPLLCSKPYSEILHIGAHNSPFVRTKENKFTVAGNQFQPVTAQLSAGVRLLQAQLHDKDGAARLCHTTCDLLDAGSLEDWLGRIARWLADRPSEVVTILLVNDDKIPAATLARAYEESGLSKLSFVPDGSGTWPSLRRMIDQQRRVVTFLSAAADTSHTPYLLPEFDHVFETPFEVIDPTAFTCDADRPRTVRGHESETRRIGLMNHFMYTVLVKDPLVYGINDTYSDVLNGDKGVGNLKDGVERCAREWGKRGGFVLLDFVDKGDAIDIADDYNGVDFSYNRDDFPDTPHPDSDHDHDHPSSGHAKNVTSVYGDMSAKERIEVLVNMVHVGKKVTKGDWVFASGKWVGAWDTDRLDRKLEKNWDLNLGDIDLD